MRAALSTGRRMTLWTMTGKPVTEFNTAFGGSVSDARMNDLELYGEAGSAKLAIGADGKPIDLGDTGELVKQKRREGAFERWLQRTGEIDAHKSGKSYNGFTPDEVWTKEQQEHVENRMKRWVQPDLVEELERHAGKIGESWSSLVAKERAIEEGIMLPEDLMQLQYKIPEQLVRWGANPVGAEGVLTGESMRANHIDFGENEEKFKDWTGWGLCLLRWLRRRRRSLSKLAGKWALKLRWRLRLEWTPSPRRKTKKLPHSPSTKSTRQNRVRTRLRARNPKPGSRRPQTLRPHRRGVPARPDLPKCEDPGNP